MIRLGLLDTTVPRLPGSMSRYREQLVTALEEHASDSFQVKVEFLGCDPEQLRRVPRRFQMWARHWRIWKAAKQLDAQSYDVLHLLDGSFGYVVKALKGSAVTATVHDVIPRLQMEGAFDSAPVVRRGARWLIGQCLDGIRYCECVCADSQSTANDLKRFGVVPRNGVDVVPLAVEAERFSGPRLRPGDAGQDGPFVFHLGNNGFYKNRQGVVETFARIDPDLGLKLVLAGPPADDALRGLVDRLNVASRVMFVEHPSGEQLSQYYRSASVFLFPSVYEGFGWPPLEAMCAGCPVVSSNAGSLGEVVATAGLTSDCHDHQGLAAQVEQLIRDPAFREQQVAAGLEWVKRFSIEQLARQMADHYRQVARSRA